MPRDDAIYTRLDLPDDGVPTVAVIGAIGADKGARRLERLVELTRTLGLRLRWVLIGYLDRGREQSQSADAVFTQHGPFDSREIGALLEHYRVVERLDLFEELDVIRQLDHLPSREG